MERIAIISDIHGNLEALKEVLEDIERRGIKRIFCLGDIVAKGVNPSECIKLVRENCEVVIQGNCDDYFTRNWNKETANDTINWNQKMLSQNEKNYLKSLPFSYEFYMSGSLIRLFHASPTANNKPVSFLDPPEEIYKQFLPSEKTMSQKRADVVIYGHTHSQNLDKLYNRTLINIGSVGNATDIIRDSEKDANFMETTQAHYLIIEGKFESKIYDAPLDFTFVRIPYDIKKELETEKENISKSLYEKELLEGRYRNMKRIASSFKERGIDVEVNCEK